MVGETGGKRDQWHFWWRPMAGTNGGDQWRRPMARTGRKDFRQLRVDHRCPPDALAAVPKGSQISSVGG